MDSLADTWLCSYALVLVILIYIVYNLVSIEFELETFDNVNHGDILVIFSDDFSEIIIIDIEETY